MELVSIKNDIDIVTSSDFCNPCSQILPDIISVSKIGFDYLTITAVT